MPRMPIKPQTEPIIKGVLEPPPEEEAGTGVVEAVGRTLDVEVTTLAEDGMEAVPELLKEVRGAEELWEGGREDDGAEVDEAEEVVVGGTEEEVVVVGVSTADEVEVDEGGGGGGGGWEVVEVGEA